MIEDISPDSSREPPTGTDTQTHRFEHEPSESPCTSVSITRAVASVAEVDPLSLQPRLYDVVDPDALETLLSSDRDDSDLRITFSFGSYVVTVTHGEILVREPSGTSR